MCKVKNLEELRAWCNSCEETYLFNTDNGKPTLFDERIYKFAQHCFRGSNSGILLTERRNKMYEPAGKKAVVVAVGDITYSSKYNGTTEIKAGEIITIDYVCSQDVVLIPKSSIALVFWQARENNCQEIAAIENKYLAQTWGIKYSPNIIWIDNIPYWKEYEEGAKFPVVIDIPVTQDGKLIEVGKKYYCRVNDEIFTITSMTLNSATWRIIGIDDDGDTLPLWIETLSSIS